MANSSVFLVLVSSIVAAPPNRPTTPRAYADHGVGHIVFKWMDNSTDEDGFQVYRRVDNDPPVLYDTVAPDTQSYPDANVDSSHEYRYQVRAFNTDGFSMFTEMVRQNMKLVWPVPDSHEILHNWQDTIGECAIDTNVWPAVPCGFHQGLDIQNQAASNNPVFSVVGGVVTVANNSTADNGVVRVKILQNGVFYRHSYHHLNDGLPADVIAGATLYGGQNVGRIGDGWFPTFLMDHLHFSYQDDQLNEVGQHPLLWFASPLNLDPKERLPALIDHVGTPPGTWLYQRQGASEGIYLTYDATHPLDDDVDIIVEMADELGTNPDQVPVKLAYWIEGPTGGGCTSTVFFDVKNASAPYVLFDFKEQDFCAEPDALELSRKVTDHARNHGPDIWEFGEQYQCENYKHFIITNTSGTYGSPAWVDSDEYWNTNAKNDGGSETSAIANYAGQPDTTKASDARFPDGTYTIHVLASDLIHFDVDLTTRVRIENFCPIVCSATPTGELPCATTTTTGSVSFNEPMNTGVNPTTIVSVQGAVISDVEWATNQKITFVITGLINGGTYIVSVEGSNAKDQPGTPGNRLLDGNQDGTCGDDYTYQFTVGTVGPCCPPFTPGQTGACCLADGTCVETCDVGCVAAGGEFWPGTCASGVCSCEALECGTYVDCGNGTWPHCACFREYGSTDGHCMVGDMPCSTLQQCPDGSCPDGCVCTVDTCCNVVLDYNVCLCGPCDGMLVAPPTPGSVTPAGEF